MASKFIKITGEELVRKILSGERDFRRIKLPPKTNLSAVENYKEMNEYLKKISRKEHKRNCLNLRNACLKGLKAPEIWVPHAEFSYANLFNADFSNSHLSRANFAYAIFSSATLWSANLSQVDFFTSDLSNSCLSYANLYKTNMARSILHKTDFRGAEKLEEITNLDYAIISEIIVSPKEKEIIEEILKRKEYFILRGE